MDKNGATKATYLDNLLNWTKPVSLRQIGTICWRLATILKLLSRKNTLHVLYSHFQQVKTQDESLTKYQGGSRQHHVGSWNIFDLGFSKLSPDFSSMFVEFQSKYHREEQIGAQIWLKSGDGIIQIAVFWHLQFAFLSNKQFLLAFQLAIHPSAQFPEGLWCISISWFHLRCFLRIFAIAPKKMKAFSSNSTFSLILASIGSWSS